MSNKEDKWMAHSFMEKPIMRWKCLKSVLMIEHLNNIPKIQVDTRIRDNLNSILLETLSILLNMLSKHLQDTPMLNLRGNMHLQINIFKILNKFNKINLIIKK